MTAALVLSAGPVQSVLAETEASSETVQQEIPEEESTAPVKPETEVPEETELQTVPLTEQNTETETQVETGIETQTESVKESEEITETEITTEPEMVRENSEESEPETETSSESESESGNQTGQNEVGTEPETEPENEIAENVGKPMNIIPQNNIQAEEKAAASVSLTINGQASGEYSSLSAAVDAIPPYTEQATIKINSDLEVNEYISQIYDYTCKNLIIDCGGYTVSSNSTNFYISSGANVTIQNGTFMMPIQLQGGTANIVNSQIERIQIISGTVNVDGGSIDWVIGSQEQIYYAVDSVMLSEDELSLSSGEEKQLTATMEPASANGKVSVSWKSSNEQIASVSSDGTVTAITAGEATITAEVTDGITGEKGTATCAVTVANPVATVKIGDAITSYSNLDEAAAAASAADGSTLTLLDDVKDRTQPLVLSGNMTFDLGNHTLSGNISDINAGILEIQSGTVTVVKGTVFLQQNSLNCGVNICNGAMLAGNAIYQCDDKYAILIYLDGGTILGGTFKGTVGFGNVGSTILGGNFIDSTVNLMGNGNNKLQGGNFQNCTLLLSALQPLKDVLAIGYVGYDSNNTVVLDQNTEASFLYPLTLNCEIKAHDPHTYNYTGEDDGDGTHTYAEGTCTSCGVQSEGSYIVTIPKQAEIGGAVQTVSVTNNLSQDKSICVSADSLVTLEREEDPDNTQIVSEVTFKDLLVGKGQSNEQGLSFGSPVYNNDESLTIPAGTYRGTLNFSISVQ